ncbi:unnamed protein product [Discosporangium mesarthrocarpum]
MGCPDPDPNPSPSPPPRIRISLTGFVVNTHAFRPSRKRCASLWAFLRPERAGRRVLLVEKDSCTNAYKLIFRCREEREAYLTLVETRLTAAGEVLGPPEEVPTRTKAKGIGYQRSCSLFKIHVFEQER